MAAGISYQVKGYCVEIEAGQAKVFQHDPFTPRSEWKQLGESYALPRAYRDLNDMADPLVLTLQTYEIATGKFDLRDALTKHS